MRLRRGNGEEENENRNVGINIVGALPTARERLAKGSVLGDASSSTVS